MMHTRAASQMDVLKLLVMHCPTICHQSLRVNLLSSVRGSLDTLVWLNLLELNVEGSPLCSQMHQSPGHKARQSTTTSTRPSQRSSQCSATTRQWTQHATTSTRSRRSWCCRHDCRPRAHVPPMQSARNTQQTNQQIAFSEDFSHWQNIHTRSHPQSLEREQHSTL